MASAICGKSAGLGVGLAGRGVAVALALLLGACAGHEESAGSGGLKGGTYKVGKPYQVHGVWYYPAEDYNYDETGIASWYGPGFHQERTANGETFDQNDLTAAHKTLPMPSLVRVTNLDNGRSITIRINDRGPFAAGRIIDMSRRGAQLLGYEREGTAKVRVQVLADESRAIAAAARANAPLDVAESGPPPATAPRAKVEIVGLAAPTTPPPHERPPVEAPRTIPGETRDGRFMPAPVVSQGQATPGRQIYVQAGAFTRMENARRLQGRVSSVGSAKISEAKVGGTRFYRVRLGPIDSVDHADSLLSKMIEAGNTDARVIVD